MNSPRFKIQLSKVIKIDSKIMFTEIKIIKLKPSDLMIISKSEPRDLQETLSKEKTSIIKHEGFCVMNSSSPKLDVLY